MWFAGCEASVWAEVTGWRSYCRTDQRLRWRSIAVATAAVCVPLNPGFTADEWQRYFGDLQVAALLTRADMDSASRGVAHTLGIPVIDLSPRPSEGPGAFSLVGPGNAPRRRRRVCVQRRDDAFILLTSGTTSRPKMVPLTHASVCLSAYNVGAALALGPRDRLLNVLPLFHAHGLISGLLTALAAGSSCGLHAGLRCRRLLRLADGVSTNLVHGGPDNPSGAVIGGRSPQAQRSSGHSLRLIRSASSSLPPDVLGELEALFGVPVIETYGMTEAASQIAANPLARRKPGSVGQPAGAEIAIMDREGRRLPAGERGEIALRGPTITRGYDNDVAATQVRVSGRLVPNRRPRIPGPGRISLHCRPHQGRSSTAEGRRSRPPRSKRRC